MGVDVQRLGGRLRQLRELKGLSLSGLATKADISKSYLAKLERGEVDNPGLQTLQVIAEALDLTLSDLLSPGTEDEVTPTSPAAAEMLEFERTLSDLPSGLREFLDARKKDGEELPADVIQSLARIQFRGKKPRTREDWQFLYDAIRRSL